ncbi:MAG: hypothetical protein M0R37_07890 [Bacteroidales bacterium]|nr:hypothetical protein [Bacteroidales bacterium]
MLERAQDPGGEWGVVAPTWDKDARAVCVEGPSGLLRTLGPAVKDWNRSMGELHLHTGARIYITSADDGARHIQGKDLRGLWAEEIGLWQNWQMAWDESIAFAVRQEPGKILVTGTPKKGHPLVRRLLSDPEVRVSRMRTLDNAANLNPASLQAMIDRYAGTLLGRQELDGELIDDVSGALWLRSDILYLPAPLDMTRIVVAVDPSGAKDPESGNDAIGISVCGFDSYTQYGHVLADYSLTDGPAVWAKRAIQAYHQHEADLIVAESNFGGEMVRHTIHAVDPKVPVKLIHASRGKQQRAEPVAMLYKGGRVYHTHPMPELEDELATWVPGETKQSPNRLDAVVWALTELMLTSTQAKVMSAKRFGEEPIYRRGDLTLVGERFIDKER